MSRMAGKKIFVILALYASGSLHAMDAKLKHIAVIDSIRNDSVLTLFSGERLKQESYEIYSEDSKIGIISILSSEPCSDRKGYSYRTIGRFSVSEGKKECFRSGDTVALVLDQEKINITYPDRVISEKKKYKNAITTFPDAREMVLVKSSKTWIGTESGDKTSMPRHQHISEDFYIDKYEVSNSDYKKFIDQTSASMPLSWNGSFPMDKAELPVLVTYYEAEKYAAWAGKYLPSEKEWEVAANGNSVQRRQKTVDGMTEVTDTTRFPWGDKFLPENCNIMDFWLSKTSFYGYPKGMLPVTFLSDNGKSACGAANMAGNAAEWTSSWYDAYPGSKYRIPRYGKQLKVVRGGSWYSSTDMAQITKRDAGGIPSLHSDHSYGFRCAKKCDYNDLDN